MAFSSSVSSSGAVSAVLSLCVSFSVNPRLGAEDVSDGAFTFSLELPHNGDESEEGFGAEGSEKHQK